MGSKAGRSKVGGALRAGNWAVVGTDETVKNSCTARTNERIRKETYPAFCDVWFCATPGATGCVNGGSHVGFPVLVKKLVHCVALTCFSVSTVGFGVGGLVVEGNHAAIWSASRLGDGNVTNSINVPAGTSPMTFWLSIRVGELTVLTVVPAGIFSP